MSAGSDGQFDFSGGMVDRVSLDRLAENEFSSGRNIEIRDGGIRSRRGSWLLHDDLVDIDTSAEMKVTGCGSFLLPGGGTSSELLQSVYIADVDETVLIRVTLTGCGTRNTMPTPYLLTGEYSVRFVQAFGRAYALLGDDAPPLRWSGDPDDGWELVPDGISGPMPNARDGIFAYNRLWLISGENTIFISDSLSDNFNTVENSFDVDSGDGSRLNSLISFGAGRLAFGKDSSCGVINGCSTMITALDLSVEVLHDSVGCLSMDSMSRVGGDVMFADRTGVWSIQLTKEQNSSLVNVPISDSIRYLYSDTDFQFGRSFSSCYFDNYFLVAVSANGGSVPNRILVYDILSRCWAGYWDYTAVSSPDTDGLYRHFRLFSATISGRKKLVSAGAYGSVALLLNGDLKDFKGFELTAIKGNDPSIAFTSTSIDLSEHTTGTFSFRYKLNDSAGGGHSPDLITSPFTFSATGDESAGTNTYDFTYYYDFDNWSFSTIQSKSVGRIRFFRSVWHVIEIVQTGEGEPSFYEDGARIDLINNTTTGDVTTWLSAEPNPNTIAFGDINDAIIDWIRVWSPDTTTTSPSFVWFPFEEGTGTDPDWETLTDGTYAQSSGATTSFDWVDESATPTDITSSFVTRGFSFGSLFAKKAGLIGDLYFAHAQPRISMDIKTDCPFDTETFIGLSNKTYSLTAYEVGNKAAWSSDNVNDDFKTPFREDYAPLPLSIALGSNGATADVYRDRVEQFSTFAKFGYVYFEFTNDQGFVRYSAVALQSESIFGTRDEGN